MKKLNCLGSLEGGNKGYIGGDCNSVEDYVFLKGNKKRKKKGKKTAVVNVHSKKMERVLKSIMR